MLLYVIPFILLLVVAIVLKKREDANNENNSSSANAKKNNNKKSTKKNVARTARTSQRPTSVVADEVVVKQAKKPLNPDLKNNIEKLIAEKNYFSAEAKINQALNQNNAQHELYLYLLDVHLAQKDEFAVNQLINHIRSLGLNEIVVQAEEKQKAAHAENPIESIAFESAKTPASENSPNKNVAAFDALIGHTEPAAEQSHQAVEQTSPASVDGLEFNQPVVIDKPDATLQEQIQPLEFKLDSPIQQVNSAIADIAVETPTPVQEIKTDTNAPLEFTFTPQTTDTPVVEQPVDAEIPAEFKLDFSEPFATPTPVEETTPSLANALEFKLTPSEPDQQPAFNFDLDPQSEHTQHTPAALSFEAPSQAIVATLEAIDSSDPLVNAFPELAQINEIQLNLELAEQYIALGAYASARELLSQSESAYSAEQRQQSQTLLNQIAS